MISSALYVLLLMQAPMQYPMQYPGQKQIGEVTRYVRPTIPPEALAPAAADQRQAQALEQRRFVSSFNHVIASLKSFAESYNAGKIDLKKVKELKKALRDLQSDPWFKPDK